MIRSIYTIILTVLWLILMLPYSGVMYFVAKKDPVKAAKSQQKMASRIFSHIKFWAGTDLVVQGQENIPEDEAVLFVANHSAIFDVIFTLPLIRHRVYYVAKKELKKVPVLSMWMARIGCYFLDREDPRDGMNMILRAISDIENDTSVFVFPEGTRTKTGQMNPFKEGTFKIASRTGCRIVPVAITNSADVLEAHMPKAKKTRVVITVLPGFTPDQVPEEYKKKLGAYTQSLIASQLQEDRKLLPQS